MVALHVTDSEVFPITNCYEDVPNYKSEVYGHNMKTECVLYENTINLNIGEHKLSRCGQCLELVGPSKKTINCVVTGFFKFNQTMDDETENFVKRAVGVSSKILTMLTSGSGAASTIYNQVTTRQIDCKFGIKPTLHVVDTNETTATLQIINSNKIIYKIGGDNDVSFVLPNSKFYLPVNQDLQRIKGYSLDGNSTSFYDVNLTTTSSYKTDTLMPIDVYEGCSFLVTPIVFSQTEEMETLNAFKYNYYTYNSSFILEPVEPINNRLLFSSNSEDKVNILFNTRNILLISQHYDLFSITFRSEKPFNLSQSLAGLGSADATSFNMDKVVFIVTKFETYKHQDDYYYYQSFKYVIAINFTYFINTYAFEFELGEYGAMEVVDAVFNERQKSQFASCGFRSTDCYETECSYYGDDAEDIWGEGCEPQCGSCAVGYQCSKERKCVLQPNYNTRSGGTIDFLLLCLIILFLVFV